MQTSEAPRTAESLRSETLTHFEYIVSRPALFELSKEQAQRKLELAMQTLDATLALEPGQVLDADKALGWDTLPDQDRVFILDATTFLSGQLRLLKMEFAHATIGTLPPAVVQVVLKQDEPCLHNGTELSKDTIVVQWRRLPL